MERDEGLIDGGEVSRHFLVAVEDVEGPRQGVRLHVSEPRAVAAVGVAAASAAAAAVAAAVAVASSLYCSLRPRASFTSLFLSLSLGWQDQRWPPAGRHHLRR